MVFQKSSNSTKLSEVYILLTTAWRKYREGLVDDACKIAGHLLQEPILNEFQISPTEYQLVVTEIRLLITYCRISQKSYVSFISKDNLHISPHFQNQGKEIIENGPLQMGLNVVKSTNRLSEYFSSSRCGQELSRVALALRTYSVSFIARKLMTCVHGWVGLASEMKLFGKLTSDLSRQLTFSTR